MIQIPSFIYETVRFDNFLATTNIMIETNIKNMAILIKPWLGLNENIPVIDEPKNDPIEKNP